MQFEDGIAGLAFSRLREGLEPCLLMVVTDDVMASASSSVPSGLPAALVAVAAAGSLFPALPETPLGFGAVASAGSATASAGKSRVLSSLGTVKLHNVNGPRMFA